jgi:hypothetical protein
MSNPIENTKTLERYVLGVGVGAYLLAVIGLFGYVVVIRKVEPDFSQLIRPAVIILILTILLFLLDSGRRQLKDTTGPVSKIAFWSWIVVLFFYFLVVSLAVFWIGVWIFRDSGVLPPIQVEPVRYLLRPTGRADAAEISYDPKTTLRRTDSLATGYHVIQDASHMGKLEGIYVEFGPGENEIDAVLILPYEVNGKPHRVKLTRATKTFDFVD